MGAGLAGAAFPARCSGALAAPGGLGAAASRRGLVSTRAGPGPRLPSPRAAAGLKFHAARLPRLPGRVQGLLLVGIPGRPASPVLPAPRLGGTREQALGWKKSFVLASPQTEGVVGSKRRRSR